ncbi:MAG: insulinase family protein [Anaerolineae bacterium]|nr:insulinase family protein [Anaerolineae bacterium]
MMNLPASSNITRVELNNGITVLVYENFNAQSVVISGSLHAGSLYEDRLKNGVAALTASSLMRGTLNHDFDAIHTRLEVVGADAGISAGTHRAGFSGKALAEDLPLLLDVLSDALRYPAFPIEQVERLKGEILTGLQYRQQDTRFLAGQAFRENLYPSEHPYYLSTRGTLTTIPTITTDDLRAFHTGYYGPQDMKICIVGAVEAAQVVELVQLYFGDWENPQQPAIAGLPTMTPFNEVRRQHISVPGKSQSDLLMGVVGPSRLAEDYYAAIMANSILGQFGMMGRIGAAVREQSGLAYYASSRLEGGYGPGAWLISAGVNPVNVE